MNGRPRVGMIIVVGLAMASCGNSPIEAIGEGEAVDPESAAVDPLFPLLEDYSLTYSSTCGDGDHITFGTEIVSRAGDVTVEGGEAPRIVGSLEAWNLMAQAAENEGFDVVIELDGDGNLEAMIIDGPGEGTCVEVSDLRPKE